MIISPLVVAMAGQPVARMRTHAEALALLQPAREQQDLSAEITALESILEVTPWRGPLWQRVGRLYLDTGQEERAINAYKKASLLKQLDPQGQVWLADALIRSGAGEEGRILLETLETTDYFVLSQAATLLRQNLYLGSCREVLKRVVSLDPQNEALNYQLGVLLMATHPSDALVYLSRVAQDEQLVLNARYLADNIRTYQDIEQDSDFYVLTGQALSQAGQWDAAWESFNLALKIDHEDGTTWALLSEAQQQIGLDGKASLEKALAIDPQGEISNGIAGLYYRRQGDTEQALAYLDKAQKANPQGTVWQIEKGHTLADAGRLDDALVEYKSATQSNPEDLGSWVALAKFTLSHNYKIEEEGVVAARQAVLLAPDNPVYLDLLGTAYLTLGDLDSAERFFLQALELDPDEAAILIHLGQVSLYRGEKETAFAYLRQAVASASDARLREMAEQLLEQYGAR